MVYHAEIAGKSLPLRYTVNSLCAAEERIGGPLDALMDRQFTAARLLLWCGLLDSQPVALEEAGSLVSEHLARGGTLEEVVERCAEAMRLAGFFGRAARTAPATDCAADS